MSPFVRRGDIKKIRLKQYVSLRSKGRHKIYILSLICFARMDLSEPHIEDIARDMRCDVYLDDSMFINDSTFIIIK